MFEVTYIADSGELVTTLCPDMQITKLLDGWSAKSVWGFKHTKMVLNERGHAIGWIAVDAKGEPEL